MTIVERRVAGAIGLVLLVASALWLFRWFGRPPAGSYEITVTLGDAGSGMFPGNDVKIRGVRVGTVEDLRLDDQGRAVVTLTIFPRHRIPEQVQVALADKTLLGTKVVELRPQVPLDQGPFLSAGDHLTMPAENRPTPLQDVIAAIDPVLEAVDGDQLARIIDTLGAFTPEDARIAGRNLELNQQLAAFTARTADAQLDRFRSLQTLFARLEPVAEDLNRLNRTLPRWTSLLPDRQADVRANLEALRSFSILFADFLETERDTIDRLLVVGDTVGSIVEPRVRGISTYVWGVYRYALKLGVHGGNLDDGTEFAWFRVFIGSPEDVQTICQTLPPALRELAPGCPVDREGGS